MSQEYPPSKIHPADEGPGQLSIAADPAKDVVVIEFPHPMKWVAFKPEQAEKFARLLQEKAAELTREKL